MQIFLSPWIRWGTAILTLCISMFWVQQAHAAADRFFYPLESWYVTTEHGEELSSGRFHAGVDAGFELAPGAPVYAIASGVVKEAETRSLFGEVILIEHELTNGRKVVSLYGHLWPGRAQVRVGDTVKAGQQIGELGTKKNNGGWVPHIHFGIHREAYTGEWVYWGHVSDPDILDTWYKPERFLSSREAEFPTARIASPRHMLVLQKSAKKQILRLYNRAGQLRYPLYLSKKQQNQLTDITVADLTGSGVPNILGVRNTKKATTVMVMTRKGRLIREFQAFTAPVNGGSRIATGDIDGNGTQEIIVASGIGQRDRVKIFGAAGVHMATVPAFNKNGAKKGLDVTTGDLDSDGTDEIIVAKRGGKAKVGVLNASGAQLDVFRPYEASYRGGVNVAAGDVDGDTFDEIIVAPAGANTGQVFVYEQSRRQAQEFDRRTSISYVPFPKHRELPIDVSIVDWEGDGKMEVQMVTSGGTRPRLKTFRYTKKKRLLLSELIRGKEFDQGTRIEGWIPAQD